ncbi:early nodulin-like protein 1 [Cornus florida]|uniref:early nodulin-like protein 1 n=1 Tax=Cornus florida TaxID=4283 RepID=UPI00289CE5C1|nr:early nodulin-like protein 1 [Cornus florida]
MVGKENVATDVTQMVFKYKNGSDSVLAVKKDDYDKWNTKKLIMKMDDGDSVFKFDRSGPFFFISGNKDNCQKGQKLIIVVLAVRNHHKSPPSTPSPAPATTPSLISHATSATSLSPTGSSPSSAPATTPVLSPSPISHTPPATSPISPSPVTMPSVSSPVLAMTPKSHSPATHSPVPSPTSVVSPAPSIAPVIHHLFPLVSMSDWENL